MSSAHESKAGQGGHDDHSAAEATLFSFELGYLLMVCVNFPTGIAADALRQGRVFHSLLVFVDGGAFVIVRPDVLSHIFLQTALLFRHRSSNGWRIKHVAFLTPCRTVRARLLLE